MPATHNRSNSLPRVTSPVTTPLGTDAIVRKCVTMNTKKKSIFHWLKRPPNPEQLVAVPHYQRDKHCRNPGGSWRMKLSQITDQQMRAYPDNKSRRNAAQQSHEPAGARMQREFL